MAMATQLLNIARRAEPSGLSGTMANLLIALMVLLIVTALLSGILLILRQRRSSRRSLDLPSHHPMRFSTSSAHSLHRRVSARPSQSIHVFREKQFFEEYSEAPSTPSALPEIRITFPEEVDSSGKRQSGRVVVVHVGDSSSIGMAPLPEELPTYQQSRYESIDLEHVGGLIEKEARPPLGWS